MDRYDPSVDSERKEISRIASVNLDSAGPECQLRRLDPDIHVYGVGQALDGGIDGGPGIGNASGYPSETLDNIDASAVRP
ncbi:MAG: hypothetical protein ABSD75_28730 [Terriglobales bacterium]|jgi:hypothetical protein